MVFSDEELIKGCVKGAAKYHQALYEKYSPKMYPIALRYSKMQQEAEDILQEAFLKVFQNIDKFRQDSSLPYWIKRIVINTALNHQRSKLYLFPMVDVTDLKDNTTKEITLSSLSYNELLDLIKKLPSGCQVIFNLYAIEGYKHHEIGTMLEISEGTSKSQYARAKSLLRGWVEENNKINYERAGEF
ncbi:MAG: RNA polymerase sigma factor (sigma-70 family) [Cyclobacteriaceae bacterium]|jgi:RNA polymerase sigma factor (sigma-70 family)